MTLTAPELQSVGIANTEHFNATFLLQMTDYNLLVVILPVTSELIAYLLAAQSPSVILLVVQRIHHTETCMVESGDNAIYLNKSQGEKSQAAHIHGLEIPKNRCEVAVCSNFAKNRSLMHECRNHTHCTSISTLEETRE